MHNYSQSREILLSIITVGALLLPPALADDTPTIPMLELTDDIVVSVAAEAKKAAAETVVDAAKKVANSPSTTTTKNETLVDKTIAEANELLKLAAKGGKNANVDFSANQTPLKYQRPRAANVADNWTKDPNSYRDFEAVQVEVKDPLEHALDTDVVFSEPTSAPNEGLTEAENNPVFEVDEEFGQPGVVFTQDQQRKQRAQERAAKAASEAKRKELAELDGEDDADIAEVVDTLKENADEIQRRIVLDDAAPAMVQSGDKWYIPMDHMTHVELGRRERIRECLDFYYSRMLNTRDDSPWSMMHHMIAWGTDSKIWIGAPGSRHESCIGWLCANGPCEGERLLYLGNGLLKARTGPGLQGHSGQFMAMLAQTRVRADQPIQVAGQMFTVKDLIEQEKLGCRSGTELTFKLIGLVHYLNTDAEWTSSTGEHWNIQKLIREEMRQPINGTTCGGSHRLMGMTYAIRRREQEGKPVDGEFQKADIFTARYRQMAYDMQNANGTFSSDFWRSRGTWGDFDRKLKTTGHMLEWMIFSSKHSELQDPRLVSAVDWLTQMMMDNRYYDFEKGPLGHGVRALSLYDERVYGGAPGKRDYKVAAAPPALTKRNTSKRPTATATPQPASRKRGGGIFGAFRRR